MGGLIVFNFDLSAKQQFGKCYTIFIFSFTLLFFADNCRRFFYTQRDNYDGKARLSWREKYVCNFFLLKKLIDGRRILVLSQKASSNLNLWVKGSDHS